MNRRIGIFAKAPVAGHAKTRLAGMLGADGAAAIQRQLISLALARACSVPDCEVTLWVDGAPDDPFIAAAARAFAVEVEPQQGIDLGERMTRAFGEMLATAAQAIIIGTDCPAQRDEDLLTAFAMLHEADAVVQPAEDGGYVLVGLKRPQPAVFCDINWGTERVLSQTRQRCRAAGLLLAELPITWDVDRPGDLQRALDEGLLRAP